MQCLTQVLQPYPFASPWLWILPHKLVDSPSVATHTEAKMLTVEQRIEHTKEAAVALSLSTMLGFEPMVNGSDKRKQWKAKVYVNITTEDLSCIVTGPLGTRDEDKKLRVAIKGGHAIVATSIVIQGTGKYRSMRNFTSYKHGTKGVAFLGLVEYEPQEMLPAIVSAAAPPMVTRKQSQQKEYLKNLNSAYQRVADDAFAHLRDLLDLNSDELPDVYCMKPAKRRKLQSAFNLLAQCDDDLYEIAQTVAVEDTDEVEASQQSTSQRNHTQADFERSGKCLCGAKDTGMLKSGKKMLFDKMAKGKKVPL